MNKQITTTKIRMEHQTHWPPAFCVHTWTSHLPHSPICCYFSWFLCFFVAGWTNKLVVAIFKIFFFSSLQFVSQTNWLRVLYWCWSLGTVQNENKTKNTNDEIYLEKKKKKSELAPTCSVCPVTCTKCAWTNMN